jgi:uridine phosphorylase
MAVMALEILMGGGAKSVLSAGFAGSLVPELKTGDLFVPSSALSSEGTSAHYPAALRPDPSLHDRLAQTLRAEGAPSRGAVWTTDAPFREVREVRDAFRAKGAIAVEMTVSALFACAGHRELPFAAALLITDEFLPDGSWREGFRAPSFRKGLDALSEGIWRAFV